MQNRYTGDIGDFGKLGLLRTLYNSGLSIGINWYLTPDEDHNGDGKYVQYLEKECFQKCDVALWEALRAIVNSGNRNVLALQNDSILKADFYSSVLDFTGMNSKSRIAFREEWHKKALDSLSDVDIVFADPDNGILVPSAKGTVKANKYAEPHELKEYYAQKSSVVYYQHKARRQDTFYIDQFKKLLEYFGLDDSSGYGLKFMPVSQRYYFFFLQPQHIKTVTNSIHEMMQSHWGRFFRCYDPEYSNSFISLQHEL